MPYTGETNKNTQKNKKKANKSKQKERKQMQTKRKKTNANKKKENKSKQKEKQLKKTNKKLLRTKKDTQQKKKDTCTEKKSGETYPLPEPSASNSATVQHYGRMFRVRCLNSGATTNANVGPNGHKPTSLSFSVSSTPTTQKQKQSVEASLTRSDYNHTTHTTPQQHRQ